MVLVGHSLGVADPATAVGITGYPGAPEGDPRRGGGHLAFPETIEAFAHRV